MKNNPMNMSLHTLRRGILLLTLFLLSISSAYASGGTDSYAQLVDQFKNPPRQARPWVYWVWLQSNTTRAALKLDLEQMKAKGIVGCILYDCGAGGTKWGKKVVLEGGQYRVVSTDEYKGSYVTPVPTGPMPAWSPRWRKLVCYSASEAARLGLSLVVSDGLANTSGDIPAKYGEQKLAWTDTTVDGPEFFMGVLRAPKVRKMKLGFPHVGSGFFRRDVAVLAVPVRPDIGPRDVIDLTSKIDSSGYLKWQVPAGKWDIIHFVQESTGAHNKWGFYCNSLSETALDTLWSVTMAPLLREMTPEERRGMKGIEDDSWESGKVTWTKRFPEEFERRRGYDLIPYLPVLAGVNMCDATIREKVMRDYRLTISDLIAQKHYAHLRKLANENGLVCYSEAAGPDYDQADLLKTSSRVNVAMAEFWMPCFHRPTMADRFLVRNAANSNHVYGKRITMCEAFTSIGPEWQQTPFTMKPVADQAFCDGLNRICFHNFSQSPSLTAKPGYVYYAGTHYGRNITWWNETPAFNTYVSRCSAMLQAGMFHADALVYRGDNIGDGEPMKVLLPTLGRGYDYDNCNSEVLRTRTSVRSGRIVLTDGLSYRVLIIPDSKPMPFEDLWKIRSLVEAGATVVGPAPTGMAGMPEYPSQESEFKSIVGQLWGSGENVNDTGRHVGSGRVIWGHTARKVLEDEGAPPDFRVSGLTDGGRINWIHRKVGAVEVYFVASHWAHPQNVVCTFRVSGRQPELWNPVTGKIRRVTAFSQKDDCTSMPLRFGPHGSTFVVFHRHIPASFQGKTDSNYPTVHLLTRISGSWTVNFDPKWGGPSKVIFQHLTDWTSSPDSGIKYYSGTAVYHKEFNFDGVVKKGEHVLLDLGKVYDIASVKLNGQALGVVWTKPALVDVTDEIRSKNNDLVVKVVNLWPNRLIGDASLPQRRRYTETNIHKFVPTSPLLPSGLVGPVLLLSTRPPGVR